MIRLSKKYGIATPYTSFLVADDKEITQAQTQPPTHPPSVETRVDAVYPAQALAAGKEVSVMVRVTVGVDGSVTLPAQGGTAPTLQMVETGSAQDACKGANLTLGYTGSAHS